MAFQGLTSTADGFSTSLHPNQIKHVVVTANVDTNSIWKLGIWKTRQEGFRSPLCEERNQVTFNHITGHSSPIPRMGHLESAEGRPVSSGPSALLGAEGGGLKEAPRRRCRAAEGADRRLDSPR